jgi:hypothetical protein
VRRPFGTVLAGALGGALCLWIYGRTILDGTAIDWLMRADRAQSFLGWHFYRRTHESLPLGSIPDLMSPVGSSLAFSDAMPWFSVALQPLSPWLPQTFQIAGLWLLLSYVMLGLFAFRVLTELRVVPPVAIVGSALVVLSPALTRRGGHFSLCAQWLIVAAFLLVLRTRGERTIARFIVRWAALVVIACGTHPYLATMVLALALAACANGTPLCRLTLVVRDATTNDRAWPMVILARAILLVGVAALALLAFGYLTGPPAGADGFGTYSANLLALVDPDGASRLLPSLWQREGQYEGYAFVGSGALLLLVVARAWRGAGATSRNETRDTPTWRDLRLVACVVLGMALFALGPEILLGTHEVVTVKRLYAHLEPLPSVFRASGRFVWPLHYAVMLGAVVWVARVGPPDGALAAVAAAVLFQLWDGAAFYAGADAQAQAVVNRWNPLRSPAWRAAGDEYDEIRLVPPYFHESDCAGSTYPPYFYIPFAYEAGRQGMRINSGQLSRQPAEALAHACRDAEDEIASGHVDPRVVYVVSEAAMERFTAARIGLATCGRLDGFNVCLSNARRTRFAALFPADVRPRGVCTDLRRRFAPRVKHG